MNAKKYLYAAVGAQVAFAKAVQAKLDEVVATVSENATSASTDLRGRIDAWAGEGETFIGRVTDSKTIDDLASKVDFDQMQTQVHKLRDQLEDLVSTWRANFRPSEVADVAPAKTGEPDAPAAKTAAAKTAAAKTTAKKPAAKATASKPAAKATASKPAAKSTSTQKAS